MIASCSATGAMAGLNKVWWCSSSRSFVSKLYKSLVTSFLYGSETWSLLADSKKKRIQAFKTKCLRNFSASSTWSTKPTIGCRVRSTSLYGHRNLFWQLSRDGNLNCSDMSHSTTASPKPFFGEPWRVGNAVFGRGNAGWTTSKGGHPCPCRTCSQWPPAEKTGTGSLLNRHSWPPNDPIGRET